MVQLREQIDPQPRGRHPRAARWPGAAEKGKAFGIRTVPACCRNKGPTCVSCTPPGAKPAQVHLESSVGPCQSNSCSILFPLVRSFRPEDLERIRRSIVLLAPRSRAGLDREAAIAVLEELQRLHTRDRRVKQLLDEVTALLEPPSMDGRP